MNGEVEAAIEFVSNNIDTIGNAGRLNNGIALALMSAYVQYVREPHIVTGELLVTAVEDWQEYLKEIA